MMKEKSIWFIIESMFSKDNCRLPCWQKVNNVKKIEMIDRWTYLNRLNISFTVIRLNLRTLTGLSYMIRKLKNGK